MTQFVWPVPDYYTVTSGYADARSYGLHGGFDIAAPGVPTVAIGGGIVIFTGWAGSAGRSVYVELEGGYRVHYCHLSRIDVTIGQPVAAGDTIGLVGGSGHGVDGYYGSHLHLNLFAATQPATGPSHWVAWVGMWAVDPELYLRQEDSDMDADQVRAIIREWYGSERDQRVFDLDGRLTAHEKGHTGRINLLIQQWYGPERDQRVADVIQGLERHKSEPHSGTGSLKRGDTVHIDGDIKLA